MHPKAATAFCTQLKCPNPKCAYTASGRERSRGQRHIGKGLPLFDYHTEETDSIVKQAISKIKNKQTKTGFQDGFDLLFAKEAVSPFEHAKGGPLGNPKTGQLFGISPIEKKELDELLDVYSIDIKWLSSGLIELAKRRGINTTFRLNDPTPPVRPLLPGEGQSQSEIKTTLESKWWRAVTTASSSGAVLEKETCECGADLIPFKVISDCTCCTLPSLKGEWEALLQWPKVLEMCQSTPEYKYFSNVASTSSGVQAILDVGLHSYLSLRPKCSFVVVVCLHVCL